MKYKVGDKFKRMDGGLFESAEIVALCAEGGEVKYILEVQGHCAEDDWPESCVLVRRGEASLDTYQKVDPFYEVGKTYMFGDSASKTRSRYTIVDLYQNETINRWMKVQALAKVTDSGGSFMAVLTSDSFSSAIEV